MKRAFYGGLVGAALTASVFLVVLYAGLLPGGGADMAAMTEQAEHEGMDMPTPAGVGEQTEAGAAMAAVEGGEAAFEPPPDAVMITPERQQLIGLRTAFVERRSLDRTIRTVGLVEYNERLVAHIHTKINGWIEELHVDFTGELVDEGQPLLEIYSPELLSTQEEYLLALRARASLGDSTFTAVAQSAVSLLEATRRRLQLWDISDDQIEELEKEGTPNKTLRLYSPIQGFVIDKRAFEGQHVGPNDRLYTIADLREVWITADIYEYELPLVAIGQTARVTLPYFPGESFEGYVDYVYPYLTGETRTAKARLVFANPGWKLKPDMYANVEILAQVGEGLAIPEDAVIDTGTRQVAFRVLPEGHFQPVEVRIGVKIGDMLQVLEGLEEGEEIVSGATFLVDSESKLRSVLRAMGGHAGH